MTAGMKMFYFYFNADNHIDFATFIGILEKHSKVEKCQQDIVNAFRAHDRNDTGTVPASELQYILTQFGDKMSKAEGKFFEYKVHMPHKHDQ